MELKQQVTSLELSKKLRELGVKQESLWYWCSCGHEITQNKVGASICGGHKIGSLSTSDLIALPSAFTVAELGEMLPRYCEVTFRNRAEDRKQIRWNCDNQFNETEEATEADARAKCLIYLLENGIIKPNEEIPVSGNSHSGRGSMGETK